MTNINKIYTKPYLHKFLCQDREKDPLKTRNAMPSPTTHAKTHHAWSACLGSTRGTQFDVQGTNAQLLQCMEQTGKRKLLLVRMGSQHIFSRLEWNPQPCIVLPHPVLPAWPHMEMTLESLEICEADILFSNNLNWFPFASLVTSVLR